MKLACLLEAFQAPGHDREGKRMNKENNGPKDPTLGKTSQGRGTLVNLPGIKKPRAERGAQPTAFSLDLG